MGFVRGRLYADDNEHHAREAIFLGPALRLAVAQAISLTDRLRPHGRTRPRSARFAGIASD